MAHQYIRDMLGGVIESIDTKMKSNDNDDSSFWVLGNYKKTTKRIENGFKLCNDLQEMLKERAHIEKAYAKQLRSWSKKWNEQVDNGPEYGNITNGWKFLLYEAEQIAAAHMDVHDRLIDQACTEIKEWQNRNYHHQGVIQLKERKEMDDLFKTAQRPWSDIIKEIKKSQIGYYKACKKQARLRSQLVPVEPTAASSSGELVRAFQTRRVFTDSEVFKWSLKYDKSLTTANTYRSFYINDMTEVFEKCQELELDRLQFFKHIFLFLVRECLIVPRLKSLPGIYEHLQDQITGLDLEAGLNWWSDHYGVNTNPIWPQFQEYRYSRGVGYKRSLSSSAYSTSGSEVLACENFSSDSANRFQGAVSIALRTLNSCQRLKAAMNKAQEQESAANNQEPADNQNNLDSIPSTSSRVVAPRPLSDKEMKRDAESKGSCKNAQQGYEKASCSVSLSIKTSVSHTKTKKAELVRALYPYQGVESDELSFTEGEIFEKLEDEDEMGWSMGRKGCNVGLYPAGYVEVMKT